MPVSLVAVPLHTGEQIYSSSAGYAEKVWSADLAAFENEFEAIERGIIGMDATERRSGLGVTNPGE